MSKRANKEAGRKRELVLEMNRRKKKQTERTKKRSKERKAENEDVIKLFGSKERLL